MYIDKLADLGNEYKNAYHRAIKMKANDVNSSIFTDFGVKNIVKRSNFKVGDH